MNLKGSSNICLLLQNYHSHTSESGCPKHVSHQHQILTTLVLHHCLVLQISHLDCFSKIGNTSNMATWLKKDETNYSVNLTAKNHFFCKLFSYSGHRLPKISYDQVVSRLHDLRHNFLDVTLDTHNVLLTFFLSRFLNKLD